MYCNTPYSGDKDKNFYKSLSDIGKGSFLELKSFDSIFDFMMAICYREHGEDALVVSIVFIINFGMSLGTRSRITFLFPHNIL